jgi:hypothetical protein
MKTFPRRAVLLGLALVSAGAACGRKGAILPPIRLDPRPPEALTAVQRGPDVVLEWSPPTTSVEGAPLPGLAAVEVWTAAAVEDFPARAVLLGVLKPDAWSGASGEGGAAAGRATAVVAPGAVRPGASLALALRVREAGKGKLSGFSAPVRLTWAAVPLPPAELRTAVFEDRIEVRWTAPAAAIDGSAPPRLQGYRVFKSEDGGPSREATSAPVAETVFADREFQFGRTYAYFVRAAAPGEAPFAESADSLRTEVTPRDTFPPAAPTGLRAAAGRADINLSWDAGGARDLAGYRVWRRPAGTAVFTALFAAPVVENTYTDRPPEAGRRYEYAVTAVDRAGNEGPRSASVAEAVRREGP